MKVFADLHHSGLFYSLKLLFEDRLGAELYRPIGMDWFENKFWDIAKPYNDAPDTVAQYLSLDSRFKPVDGSPVLNKVTDAKPTHYEIEESEHGYTQKAITFEQFKEMDIDIVIASVPWHWVTYNNLISLHKPKAKLICQMGNMFTEIYDVMQSGVVKNLMASTINFPYFAEINTIFYHQEQPLVDFVLPDVENRKIKSYAHLLPKPEQFVRYIEAMPDFEFKAFGAGTTNGWLSGIQNIYKEMQDSQFTYHVKPGGDGYGWNWHSSYMVGRPVITNWSDYEHGLGGKLFEDNVTGINLEAGTVQENADRIRRHLAEPGKMAQAARDRFMAVVNYDDEEQKFRKFIEKLQ